MAFFLISSMSLGLFDRLQFYWQLYLIELLGLLLGLGLLKLQHLIHPGHLTGFDILVFFTNVSLSGQIFGPISSFLSWLDGFGWFWMGSIHKNIQLMLEFLKVLFLALHFSYYILLTLLMISVILLAMLMIHYSLLQVW